MMSDELINTETFPTRIQIDQRRVLTDNGDNLSAFLTMSQGRVFTEFASARYNAFPNHVFDPGHSEVLSLAGFSYILFAENYCSGVPFSKVNDDGSVTFGQPLSTNQQLGVAIAKFDSALVIADSLANPTLHNLAAVGKGRALLDSGAYAAAATAVADVDPAFLYVIQHSANATVQNNGMWEFIVNALRWGIAEQKGTNGLNFLSANDPRIQAAFVDIGFDGVDSVFAPAKYSDRASPVPLADGVEAQLITAEAALNGAGGNYLTILNGLRTTAGLPALTDPGTQDGRIDQLFRERAFWLFLTSHRLGDLRRLMRQYHRPLEQVFPTGDYFHQGSSPGTYGPQVSLVVPVQETNNPNYTNCDPNTP